MPDATDKLRDDQCAKCGPCTLGSQPFIYICKIHTPAYRCGWEAQQCLTMSCGGVGWLLVIAPKANHKT